MGAVAGLEGAYDLSEVQFPFLVDNVALNDEYWILYQHQTNLGKPGLAAMFTLSFLFYSEKLVPDYPSYFDKEFYDLNKTTNFTFCSNETLAKNIYSILN